MRASAMCARSLLYTVQYSTVLVYAEWRSAVSFFSTKEQVYIMKHNLLGIDACFECQNDDASKILRVTDRQTDKHYDYCNPLRMRSGLINVNISDAKQVTGVGYNYSLEGGMLSQVVETVLSLQSQRVFIAAKVVD